ncbi:hypothetical protein [Methanohalophilus sp.]
MTIDSSSNIKSITDMDRQCLLSVSSKLIEDLHNKVNLKRFRASQDDEVKIKFTRLLIQALEAHNRMLRDGELEDIKTRLDELEKEMR